MKTGVLAGKSNTGAGNASEVRRELMRMPNSNEVNRYDQYGGRDDGGFVQSESDRQMLLIKYIALFHCFYIIQTEQCRNLTSCSCHFQATRRRVG